MSDDRRGMSLDGVPGLLPARVDAATGDVVPAQRGYTTAQDLAADEDRTGTVWSVVVGHMNMTSRFVRGHDVEQWVDVEFGGGVRRMSGVRVVFVPRRPWRLGQEADGS